MHEHYTTIDILSWQFRTAVTLKVLILKRYENLRARAARVFGFTLLYGPQNLKFTAEI